MIHKKTHIETIVLSRETFPKGWPQINEPTEPTLGTIKI